MKQAMKKIKQNLKKIAYKNNQKKCLFLNTLAKMINYLSQMK